MYIIPSNRCDRKHRWNKKRNGNMTKMTKMAKINTIFTGSLKRGEVGEEIFISSLASSTAVKKVYDARSSAKYQDADIDFIIELSQKNILSDLTGSNRVSVELKTDYTSYQNIYYEKYSCYELHTAGCMEKTQSDLLIYYYIRKKCFYVLNTKTFRDWVHEHSADFITNFKDERGRFGIYHKEAFLIPTSSIEAAFESKKIIGKKVQVSDAFSRQRVARLDACHYRKIEILHDRRKIRSAFDDM